MIALASTSAHKAAELERLIGRPVVPIDGWLAPVEDGATFVDNARIKARRGALQAPPGAWVIADDSGLEVVALDGAPGVHSARYGSPELDDAGRVEHLLAELAGANDRRARFVCVLVALAPDGTEHVAEGHVDGSIARAAAGAGGFGYDPVFVPVGLARAVAELTAVEKDAISHRGRAATVLRAQLGW